MNRDNHMKTEISAGGVVVKKIRGTYHVLLILDMNKSWTFPKGIIEKNETKKEAAIREIREETGLTNIRYIQPISRIHYRYKRKGLIDKTVYYALFVATGDEDLRIQKEEGLKDARFVPIDDARAMVGYANTNVPLLEKAMSRIQTL